MQQQKDALKQTNQALQEYNKMQAIQQIRNDNVSKAKDDAGTYAAILDKMNQQAADDYSKDQPLYKAKNDYTKIHNEFNEFLKGRGISITNPDSLGTQLLGALFNLDLDNATAQDIQKRVALANEVAGHAPESGEWQDYNTWMADSIDHVQGH